MQVPWRIDELSMGSDAYSDRTDVRTTPDGTPYLPSTDNPRGGGPIQARQQVLVALIFLVIAGVIGIIASTEIGVQTAVCPFIFVVGIIVLIAAARAVLIQLPETDFEPPSEPEFVREVVRIETIHETVKVRCRYCGTLNLVTDTKCKSCGGNL